MLRAFPPNVQAEVQRILDGEARRLLADELDADSIRSAAGDHDDTLDGRADQRLARLKGQPVPIRDADRDDGTLAA